MGKAKIATKKNMKHTILFFLSLILSLSIHGQVKGKKDELAKSEENKKQIVGTWRLIEFSDLDTTSNVWKHRYGRNPKGYISYSKSNVVNINISSEYPLQIPKDSIATYKINPSKFWRTYALGYFGTYSVDNEKMIVTHHVTGGTIPEYIDTDQRRPFTIRADTLTIGDNKTWRRVLVKVD